MALTQHEVEVLRELERQFTASKRGAGYRWHQVAVTAAIILGLALVADGLALLAYPQGPAWLVLAATAAAVLLGAFLAEAAHLYRLRHPSYGRR